MLDNAPYTLFRDIELVRQRGERLALSVPPDELLALESLLTERELEVLRDLSERLTNKEIARKLVVSPATVKKRVRNILTKLNASTRTEAAAIAHRQNLVDGQPGLIP